MHPGCLNGKENMMEHEKPFYRKIYRIIKDRFDVCEIFTRRQFFDIWVAIQFVLLIILSEKFIECIKHGTMLEMPYTDIDWFIEDRRLLVAEKWPT